MVDRYSRMVAYLKVILPLAALALLSTVFLISRNINPTAVIPFAEHEITKRLRDKQITAPVFSGITSNGDEISVTAAQARPGGAGEPATATDLLATVTSTDGNQITLKSAEGTLDLLENRAIFEGAVEIETTSGYVLETEILSSSLNEIDAETAGEVKGYGPIGQLTAGKMTIHAENWNGSVHMLFTDGVKLVYTPKQLEK